MVPEEPAKARISSSGGPYVPGSNWGMARPAPDELPAEKPSSSSADAVPAARLELPPSGSEPAETGTPRSNSVSTPSVKKAQLYHGTREVEVAIIIQRIFDINTLHQTFGAEIRVAMMWLCTEDESPPSANEDDGDWTPKWSPKYRIHQLIEEKNCMVTFTTRHRDGKVYVLMDALHLVIIQEAMELRYFPADFQDLTIEFVSKLPVERAFWVPMPGGPWVTLMDNRCLLNDFVLMKELPFTSVIHQVEKGSQTFTTCMVKVKVSRQAYYYYINVLMICGLICSFSFFSYFMHPADIEGRLGIDFNLLLTAVAFKFVLVSMLPSLSYVTTLDEYVLGGFFFLTFITCSHSLVPYMYMDYQDISPLTYPPESMDQEERLINADHVAFLVTLTMWVLFNIWYACRFVFRRRSEERKFMDRSIQEQKEGLRHDHIVKTNQCGISVETKEGEIHLHEQRGHRKATRKLDRSLTAAAKTARDRKTD